MDEIVAVMRHTADDRHGWRLRAMIVVLWRVGLRIQEALTLAEHELDERRGSILVRRGQGDHRREGGMDEWACEELRPWLSARSELPVGPLFCVIDGPTRGCPWSGAAVRAEFRRVAARADVRYGLGGELERVHMPELMRREPTCRRRSSEAGAPPAPAVSRTPSTVGSLSLYASLGFWVKEPAVVITGRPRSGAAPDVEVRPLEQADLRECGEFCLRVHGFERTTELRDAIEAPVLSPFVAVRDGRITAYATTLSFFPAAHGVAETEADMRALILGALSAAEQPASFLLPTRQARLFRWSLTEGLRVIKPMTYMAIGEYADPSGCWIPSVLY